jgi:hypothetical protein
MIRQWVSYRPFCMCAMTWSLVGCVASGPMPPPAPFPTPGTAGGAAPTVVAVVPASSPPLTLPQYLGLDALGRGVVGGVCLARLKIATHWPALQPSAKHAPRAIGDPANLQSPSPAVATAAAAQQAAAEAPAKVAALGYLAKLGCAQVPGSEEAFLAGLDDAAEEVRAAAAQAVAASQRKPGSISCECSCACAGCCTPAIRAKLTQLAYEQSRPGCYSEPSPRVRRQCRLALAACGGEIWEVAETPEEIPPAASLQAIQISTTSAATGPAQ